ncbi:YfhE family protein [Bacillus sp. ISL-39]|nr:YfhE family protein [Bacillus sp. ISL-39]MBT2637550.1 YfhE family protein [Bacillus sp. ISL-39]
MDKKKRDKTKSTLSSMQEVTYNHEFKKADRAGGYTNGKR